MTNGGRPRTSEAAGRPPAYTAGRGVRAQISQVGQQCLLIGSGELRGATCPTSSTAVSNPVTASRHRPPLAAVSPQRRAADARTSGEAPRVSAADRYAVIAASRSGSSPFEPAHLPPEGSGSIPKYLVR